MLYTCEDNPAYGGKVWDQPPTLAPDDAERIQEFFDNLYVGLLHFHAGYYAAAKMRLVEALEA
jgi:hypothetical protein